MTVRTGAIANHELMPFPPRATSSLPTSQRKELNESRVLCWLYVTLVPFILLHSARDTGDARIRALVDARKRLKDSRARSGLGHMLCMPEPLWCGESETNRWCEQALQSIVQLLRPEYCPLWVELRDAARQPNQSESKGTAATHPAACRT
ncbi:hypothetical protein OBBRIDRAFT_482454 [Obba rivulosa]|uniref:Uncharacterized protein n=1 Tax=Obba rivulosa TaxID=1052685 RepID=A0A8E2AG48_9APHY|nr:hypothetical protein OBBRIDRAFT_482454 [Obba rivulosa]